MYYAWHGTYTRKYKTDIILVMALIMVTITASCPFKIYCYVEPHEIANIQLF